MTAMGKALRAAILLAAALNLAAAPAWGEGMRGLLVMSGDRVIAEEGADQLFVPASVQKLVVAAAALHYLGPDHQIETVIRADGPITGGVLRGDLVLEAAADPTWSAVFFANDFEAPFRALAEQVRRAGIARVDGDLVLDLSRFPGRQAPASRSQMEMGLGFGAPVSGLAVDENTAEIRIAAGRRVGDRASVTSDAGVDLRNDTTTVAATRHSKGSVEFLPQWGDGSIRVRGEYPLSEAPYTVRVSLPAPERVVGAQLREQLSRAGIELTGAVRITTAIAAPPQPAAAGGGDVSADSDPVVARLFSPPLSEIVVPVLRESSNWTAEMLVLQVALARTGEGRYDDGIEALEAFLTDEVGDRQRAVCARRRVRSVAREPALAAGRRLAAALRVARAVARRVRGGAAAPGHRHLGRLAAVAGGGGEDRDAQAHVGIGGRPRRRRRARAERSSATRADPVRDLPQSRSARPRRAAARDRRAVAFGQVRRCR